MRKIIAIIACLGFSVSALAEEIGSEFEVTDVPQEVENVMEENAGKMGHDLGTEEGRQKFGKHMKKKRKDLAKKNGFNLDTPKGKKGFKEFMDKRIKKIAKEKKVDFKEPKGREVVVRELIARGEVGAVPFNREGFKRNGWKHEPRPIDLKKMPKEVQGVMMEKATDLGIDITTPKGQKAFGKFMAEERKKHAKKLGHNLDTPKGRKAYSEHRKKEAKKLAKQLKANMKNPKGREKVLKQLAKKGEFAMLPTNKKSFNQFGMKPPKRFEPKNQKGKGKKMGHKHAKRGHFGKQDKSMGHSMKKGDRRQPSNKGPVRQQHRGH